MTQMTQKQSKFAECLAEGKSQSDAYRTAYATASNTEQTVWSEASRLAKHPKVASRVDALRAEKEVVRRTLVLDREEAILAQLEHEAFTAKTDSARIRALELLGRHAGMFTERVEVERVDRPVAQIEADIRARLERLGWS